MNKVLNTYSCLFQIASFIQIVFGVRKLKNGSQPISDVAVESFANDITARTKVANLKMTWLGSQAKGHTALELLLFYEREPPFQTTWLLA